MMKKKQGRPSQNKVKLSISVDKKLDKIAKKYGGYSAFFNQAGNMLAELKEAGRKDVRSWPKE